MDNLKKKVRRDNEKIRKHMMGKWKDCKRLYGRQSKIKKKNVAYWLSCSRTSKIIPRYYMKKLNNKKIEY